MLSEMMKEELVHGLREIFHENMRMIILYGSVAREESTPESDIDIAIIMREDIDEKTQEKFFQWSADMDLKYDRVFSIIDILEERMEKWGKILPFYKNVQEEGIILWKAA
ncbi:MAG TPA: nucleotidyltransferase domain-containing protein [Candidatus Mediterraneibacter stercoravium]|uniref:Nucleotidyltransferase domain-containing protein n=1 Tax=Candidatus Mediterraneibacter stercoravium TaxID=2838685 RepID=A0A9D2G6V9_9FIRM|nr:nucleotidyltransferase domain-containing protein [Candidatus Mediterraneibacter stercoravium]